MHQHEAGGRLDVEEDNSEDIQDIQDIKDIKDISPISEFLLNLVKTHVEKKSDLQEIQETKGFPTLFRPINM